MRRVRTTREFRESLLRSRKVSSLSERREAENQKLIQKTRAKRNISAPMGFGLPNKPESIREHRAKSLRPIKTPKAHSQRAPLPPLQFVSFDEYRFSLPQIRVAHVIESLGMGGAQTMTFELVNGLSGYYQKDVSNTLVCVGRTPSSPSDFLRSYNLSAVHVQQSELQDWLSQNRINIAVHHRISQSRSIFHLMPPQTRYVLVNHTWNNLGSMSVFDNCDFYVSVCSFLHGKTRWHKAIHDSRRAVILNGVENKYLESIKPTQFSGKFVTGRCHRLVTGKFRESSLSFLDHYVKPHIPGFQHVILGSSPVLRGKTAKYSWLKCMGSVANRTKKMSAIKSFDAYFYDTYAHEGASIAVLESLACGVPVICRPYGGNSELVKNGINGFVCQNQDVAASKLRQLGNDPVLLGEMKDRVVKDFDNRLHIRHTASKYMQVFEHLLR